MPVLFWKVVWRFFFVQPLSWSSVDAKHKSLVITHNHSKEECLIVAQNKKQGQFKFANSIILWSAYGHPYIEHFYYLNFASNDNYNGVIHIEFFGEFSCNCKMINLHGCAQMVVFFFKLPASMLPLVMFAKLFEAQLPSVFVSSSWIKTYSWWFKLSQLHYEPF